MSNHEEEKGAQGRSLGLDGSVGSDRSDRSVERANAAGHRRLRPSGGYRNLRSFHAATIIYDATVAFCGRFLDKRSRTVDQMVQAARSGRQNIAEGSRAAATSSQTELRLVNIARASLDELLLDYEDFLRQRHLPQWAKDDPRSQTVRKVGREHRTDRSDPTDPSDYAPYARWLTQEDPSVVANAIICMIHQANYLLDRQIAGLEREFVQEGGYSEQLAAARIAERTRQREADRSDPSDPTDPSDNVCPACPLCNKPMVLRTARTGARAGSQFWGCSGYPECKGKRAQR
ncbi:MAG: four helix bundle suffix domain-containing protein [Armatimonadota bacterium]|nr:four helix bundle suffix domain-containing protein [Armatimonadota bacterium]